MIDRTLIDFFYEADTTVGDELVYVLLPVVILRAQKADVVDRSMVLGQVVNRPSGEPELCCRFSFLQGADTMVTVLCDGVGEYGTDPMPVGTYGLSVSLRVMTLFRTDSCAPFTRWKQWRQNTCLPNRHG